MKNPFREKNVIIYWEKFSLIIKTSVWKPHVTFHFYPVYQTLKAITEYPGPVLWLIFEIRITTSIKKQ